MNKYRLNDLSFSTLRDANIKRIPLFKDAKGNRCHKKEDGSDWSTAQWLQAVVGELGELANLLKKVERGDFPIEEVSQEIIDEFADVVTYLDILAYQFRIDLGEAVRRKFNKVSHRVNANVFIGSDDNCHRYDDDMPRGMED